MPVTPISIDPTSPFLGEACALCKEAFRAGDEMVICPEDATRHHTACWQANGNRCTAYGCTGAGQVGPAVLLPPRRQRAARQPISAVPPGRGASKVRVMPATSFSWAQSCLVLAIAIAIILCALGCFGLWAIADYIAINILHWPYRDGASGLLPWWQLTASVTAAYHLLRLL